MEELPREPPEAYTRRTYPPCAGCAARGQSTDAQAALRWGYRARFWPSRVRLLLIAESPPFSATGARIRHFYHPEAPSPDTLFRATAPVLLADRPEGRVGSRGADGKEAALALLAQRGFLLLDSAQCPVNHLADGATRRSVARRCAAAVLREMLALLDFTPEARICLVVRSTVPEAVLPMLAQLGLADRVHDRRGLPFPGRWTGHRAAYQAGLTAAAAAAGWEEVARPHGVPRLPPRVGESGGEVDQEPRA
jgi:hypothetical protein